MLTQETADKITKYLDEHAEERERLLNLAPEEAVTELKKVGIDCTVQELKEYGKALEIALSEGELTDDQLENVAGGVVGVSVGVAIAWGIGGAVVGFLVNRKLKW